ncbi:succinylglutamate desuccinylase [Trinickia caryophylli]|uniref:Succinylglutamate desuccinylase n=1 Tax=Trinickia caryophylli TaxID=28094 RepID=A0A1X7DX71_TRICW|nr:succinylglutamate desuccinylase [Trinickia caryophylli]PMS14189.1 succinylglutamate desuccinylase [Trinickia caryophylli]TRX17889.1 succinylglutamate desuccinylase [Trinickia caryophylli]WQE11340.1 succinylglutamate desuccinylase [Trinickia caryophylli]SMF23402.1 succinylglutamate desuccinylase [Trinickia caryophylli]GLU32496.1 succinylglutamate desuccinylase [Trinickia caryophylli]
MTSSASAPASAVVNDFLAFTLAGARPDRAGASGVCASGARYIWRDDGVLAFEPSQADEALAASGSPPASVVVSAGVHGDETAPIELVSRMVADIASGVLPLGCRLLVVLGNVEAMRAGRRYLDDDMNRLFCGRHAALPASGEARRAAALEAATMRFFRDAAPAGTAARWHIDMHTAIRASVFEQFALLPHTGEAPSRAMMAWLARARIAAVLLHTAKSSTYSQYTAQTFGATACTLELGKIEPFGHNDLLRFASADRAVRALATQERLEGGEGGEGGALPRVFTVVDQITKRSEAFELYLDVDVPNFTALDKGTLLAADGDYRYVVSRDGERIVFPNPGVKPGLRAGLIVVETGAARPA